MQTRNIWDVRTIVALVSLVAFASLAVWSLGFGLASIQSLQNQVNDLTAQKDNLQAQVSNMQNDVASLEAQLTEKQEEIEYLQQILAIYRIYVYGEYAR